PRLGEFSAKRLKKACPSIGRCKAHHRGKPGRKDSGNTTSRAPSAPASPIMRHAFAAQPFLSSMGEEACATATTTFRETLEGSVTIALHSQTTKWTGLASCCAG